MKKIVYLFVVMALAALISACGAANGGGSSKAIAEKKINENLNVSILSTDGKLKNGDQQITLKFTDGSGNPVEMKAASLNFKMPAMGSMAEMNDAAKLNTTGTPGEFSGPLKLQMAGDWIAQISYEGKETGKTTISMTAY
ncbi:MAG: FixH family protein [Pyrinomonadaceae bacterium]|nr:FixH family protein [Pyrinomonadaceae bacterium]